MKLCRAERKCPSRFHLHWHKIVICEGNILLRYLEHLRLALQSGLQVHSQHKILHIHGFIMNHRSLAEDVAPLDETVESAGDKWKVFFLIQCFFMNPY